MVALVVVVVRFLCCAELELSGRELDIIIDDAAVVIVLIGCKYDCVFYDEILLKMVSISDRSIF